MHKILQERKSLLFKDIKLCGQKNSRQLKRNTSGVPGYMFFFMLYTHSIRYKMIGYSWRLFGDWGVYWLLDHSNGTARLKFTTKNLPTCLNGVWRDNFNVPNYRIFLMSASRSVFRSFVDQLIFIRLRLTLTKPGLLLFIHLCIELFGFCCQGSLPELRQEVNLLFYSYVFFKLKRFSGR